jgi:hypothetical protein
MAKIWSPLLVTISKRVICCAELLFPNFSQSFVRFASTYLRGSKSFWSNYKTKQLFHISDRPPKQSFVCRRTSFPFRWVLTSLIVGLAYIAIRLANQRRPTFHALLPYMIPGKAVARLALCVHGSPLFASDAGSGGLLVHTGKLCSELYSRQQSVPFLCL